ncbi:MAG: fumarate hydratase [Eubacteriaceae bacterium]
MREIDSRKITETVSELCIRANTHLSGEQEQAIHQACSEECSPTGKGILCDILENLTVADKKGLPICQDTGMAVVFLEIGQDVHISGDYLEDAVNEGVRQGYTRGWLRKSVVSDPIRRVNTGDNTPAVIHTKIVPGDKMSITVMPKGFGSENTSALKMLKPSDGEQGVEDFIVETVIKGAPNACAPVVIGVGIGGTFEKAALLAKAALRKSAGSHHPDPLYADLESRILDRIKDSGIGPMGLGGIETALDVHILETPTHIAGLPVAVNICCYADRIAGEVL